MVNAANIQKIPETAKRFREYFYNSSLKIQYTA